VARYKQDDALRRPSLITATSRGSTRQNVKRLNRRLWVRLTLLLLFPIAARWLCQRAS
jgi:hypothetical protein